MSKRREAAPQPISPGGMSGGRAALWATLIVVVGGAAFASRYFVRHETQAPRPSPGPAPDAVVTGIEPPPAPPIDWIAWREKAWHKIEPRLEAAEREAAAVAEEEIATLAQFFEGRRAGVRPFAEAVLSFSGKWQYVKSKLPTAEDDAHLAFLNEQFETHVFKIDDLKRLVEQSVTVYVDRLQAIENRLLADIRGDLSEGLPPGTTVPGLGLDEPAFRREYGRLLVDVSKYVAGDTKVAVSREAASFVAGEVAAVVAVRVASAVAARLGVSAGVLGAGAASGWATFGIGLVAAVVIDFAIDKAVKAGGYDPVEKVSIKVEEVLGQVRTLLIDGDSEAREALEKMRRMAIYDPDAAVREECKKAVEAIEGGGQLGLRNEMLKLRAERGSIRRDALRKLVGGVGAEG